MSLMYEQMTGRSSMSAPQSPPQMSATGQAHNMPTAGAESDLTNWQGNPAIWYAVLVLVAMYLARAAGYVRGR